LNFITSLVVLGEKIYQTAAIGFAYVDGAIMLFMRNFLNMGS
jgi:hypothetical protein